MLDTAVNSNRVNSGTSISAVLQIISGGNTRYNIKSKINLINSKNIKLIYCKLHPAMN